MKKDTTEYNQGILTEITKFTQCKIISLTYDFSYAKAKT